MKPKSSAGGNGKKSKTVATTPAKEYLLRLYVTGASPRSLRAVANIKRICEKHLSGQYSLEVVDIYQCPQLTRTEQIIAAPTLVKCRPAPLKRWIGDLSDTERILAGLNPLPEALA